jgi:cell division protein FtsL
MTVAPGSGAFELLSIAVVVIVMAVIVVHGISVVKSTQLKSTQLQAEYPNVEETKTRYVEGVLSLSEFEDELELAWDADMSWPDAEDNNE